jgi:hypothetical protein
MIAPDCGSEYLMVPRGRLQGGAVPTLWIEPPRSMQALTTARAAYDVSTTAPPLSPPPPPFPPQVEYSLLTESETLAALGQGSFVTSVTR